MSIITYSILMNYIGLVHHAIGLCMITLIVVSTHAYTLFLFNQVKRHPNVNQRL